MILGLKPKELSIMPMGISISFKVEMKDYNKKLQNANILALKRLLIAIAGPFTNLLIIIISNIFPINIANISNEILIYSNIVIGLFNLIPIYPLDGGRILKELFHILFGLKKSIIISNKLSNITIITLTFVSSIAIYYYKNIAIILIITYLWGLVLIENRRYNQKMNIYKIIESSDMVNNMNENRKIPT